jgi:hypothetical protein
VNENVPDMVYGASPKKREPLSRSDRELVLSCLDLAQNHLTEYNAHGADLQIRRAMRILEG